MMSRIAGLFAHLTVLLMLACSTANADDLYQAQAIVTGEGAENRQLGFARALEQVLVKVSGDPRLAGEPAVAAMGAQAGTFVSKFRYRDRMAGIPVHDEQGTRDRPFDLTVDFIPEKIDAALRSLGRKPWTEPRPRIVLFLGVQNGPTAYTLAADGERGRDLRDALAAEAGRLGMPALLPDQAALAEAGMSFGKLRAAVLLALDEMAKSAGGDVALAGSLVWSDTALGWMADWRLASLGKTYRWQIGGVSFDAAFRNGLGGAAQILSGHGPPS
jgi:hypothetical protein